LTEHDVSVLTAAPAPPTEYTLVPYEELKAAKLAAEQEAEAEKAKAAAGATSSSSSDPNTAVSPGATSQSHGAMNVADGFMGHDRIENEASGDGNGRLRNRF
jgi:hypothetical protein